MTAETGWPAFPCHPGVENSIYDGMTLRDYFAAKAMQAMESRELPKAILATDVAEAAYEMADAMLKARKA
jgi:hypothetical protein